MQRKFSGVSKPSNMFSCVVCMLNTTVWASRCRFSLIVSSADEHTALVSVNLHGRPACSLVLFFLAVALPAFAEIRRSSAASSRETRRRVFGSPLSLCFHGSKCERDFCLSCVSTLECFSHLFMNSTGHLGRRFFLFSDTCALCLLVCLLCLWFAQMALIALVRFGLNLLVHPFL